MMDQDSRDSVKATTYRILLIDSTVADYTLIRSHLDGLQTEVYQLDWIDADTEPQSSAIAGYDVYVLEYLGADHPNAIWLPILRAQPLCVPLIALTATVELGLETLHTGVADYWAKEDLSRVILERSLRLLLHPVASQQQHFLWDEEQILDQNERAFQLSDERLHGVLRSIHEAVWSFDPRINKLLYLNSAVESIYGRSLSDFLADFTIWRSCIHPDDRQIVDRADQSLAETQSFHIEYRIFHANGSIRWIREHTQLIFDPTGTPIRRNSIATDITDIGALRRTQTVLRQSEERFDTLARLVPIGIFRTDAQGNCLYVNQRWCQISGLTPEDAQGRGWVNGLHPDDRDQVATQWMQAVASDCPFQAEYRFQTPNRQITWVLGQAVAEKDDTGQILGYIGAITDITEPKQAETALHRQIEQERLVSQISQHIRQSLDLDCVLNTTVAEVRQLLCADRALIFRLYANQTGVVTHESVKSGEPSTIGLRFEDEEFPPDCYQDYCQGKARNIPDITVDETAVCLREYLENLNVKSRLVVPIVLSPSSSPVAASSDVEHSSTRSDSPLWGLLILHQCSQIRYWQPWETKLLEQLATRVSIAIDHAQLLENATRNAQELARSNRELEQFAYVASHDLQEPLRTVISFVQLLEEEYHDRLDGEGLEYMDFIVNAANRMQTLIRDLLTFSRVGTRGKTLKPTPCDQVLDTAIANLQGAIAENHAIITRDPLPTIMADEFQLMQLFQNLIGNALKFRSTEPPRIHISVSSQTRESNTSTVVTGKSTEWVFSIRDNGIGIDPKYTDRIFVIFQRLQAQQEFEGTGIGLAICQKIVRRHGGRIWVESIPGQGSTFYWTLPHSELMSHVSY